MKAKMAKGGIEPGRVKCHTATRIGKSCELEKGHSSGEWNWKTTSLIPEFWCLNKLIEG